MTRTAREPEPKFTPFDWDAATKRLRAVTTDAAMLASCDRVTESEAAGDDNDAMGDFIANAMRLNLSFNYIICGSGEPFIEWEVPS